MATKPAKQTKTTPTPKTTPAPAAQVTTSRKRDKVLAFYTAAELNELIGADVKIGVSLKSLKKAITDITVKQTLAAKGL